MNDRFKFRVWQTELKEPKMKYNSGLIINNNEIIEDGCVVMQCTGLKDKNGTLIYEGDIIYKKGTKNIQGKKINSTVIWDKMYAQFNISDENGFHRLPSNSKNIEVIGNIYENPELLQEHK